MATYAIRFALPLAKSQYFEVLILRRLYLILPLAFGVGALVLINALPVLLPPLAQVG